jgi:hypothetical protein
MAIAVGSADTQGEGTTMMKRIMTDRNARRFFTGDFLLHSTGVWYKVALDPRPLGDRCNMVAVNRAKVTPYSEPMIQVPATDGCGFIIPAFAVAFRRDELVAMLEADALVSYDEVTYGQIHDEENDEEGEDEDSE